MTSITHWPIDRYSFVYFFKSKYDIYFNEQGKVNLSSIQRRKWIKIDWSCFVNSFLIYKSHCWLPFPIEYFQALIKRNILLQTFINFYHYKLIHKSKFHSIEDSLGIVRGISKVIFIFYSTSLKLVYSILLFIWFF